MAGSDRPLVSGVPELLMPPLSWPLCYLRMRRNHAL